MTCSSCQPRRARSIDDHRRFFAIIAAAFDHWPEAHEFQPSDSEHLRSWLICKAGYYESTEINVDWAEDEKIAALVALAIEAALSAARGRAFVRVHCDRIAVFTPQSIRFDKLSQKDFTPLRQAVEDVIKAETGIDPEALLTMRAA